MTVQSREIEALGLRTHFLEAGTGEGPPLLLIHGGGAGADAQGNWSPLIELLSPRHHVIAVDMVGFGRSEKPQDDDYGYSQDERDAHLTAFVEALGLAPMVLVGNSMGGLTALGVTARRPGLVERLVLMGSAGIPIPISPELGSILHYDFTRAGMARIVEGLTAKGFVPPEGMVDYRFGLTDSPADRYAYGRITAWMRAEGGLKTTEDVIRAVACPTLVVAGKNDRVVPVAAAYRFLELIPQSWGAVIPRCGHWPMLEHPAAFADILEGFLERSAA